MSKYPILYKSNETDFFAMGLGPIQMLKATVTQERNGIFIFEGEILTDNPLFPLVLENYIIKADADHLLKDQRFRIKRIVPNHDGKAQIYAEHVSYLSRELTIKPEVNITGSAQIALNQWKASIVESNPFVVSSDITTSASTKWRIDKVENPMMALGGVEGSILDRWGGEYLFDNYHISLLKKRGKTATNILAYGRNITDFEQERNILSTYTSIAPYAIYTDDREQEVIVTVDGFVVDSGHVNKFPNRVTKPIDFSSEFGSGEIPTKARLTTLAQQYIADNEIGVPTTSIKISFLDLSQTADYADYAFLEQVNLCDDVRVHYPKLGVNTIAKVVRVVWNVLTESYDEIEIGQKRMSLASQIQEQNKAIQEINTQVNQSQVSADGKNMIFYGLYGENGSGEPSAIKIGDSWFKPNGLETELYVWTGIEWKLIMSTSSFNEINETIGDLDAELELTTTTANDAVAKAEQAISDAGFATDIVNQTIEQIDTAVANVGFTSLYDTLQNMNDITMNAEQNAQQAITDASDAYELAQTSISEAQTAQENSLAALGKADNALDGVSNLDVRVDDVEAELELKADNTFMTEDGELITLSNAITFNANRFSSDMSRIESRVESLAGEINLVILRDAFENTRLLGGEVYPNATVNIGSDTMSEMINVVAGEELALSKNTVGGDNTWRISFYDNSHNYVTRVTTSTNQYILTVPVSATKMWVSYPTDSQPQIVRGSDFIPYRPNLADQMTSEEVNIFRNEYDEFADKTERRLTAIDSSDGRLSTAELLIAQTADGLALKADQTNVDELTGEVESLGTEFDIVAGQVSSKVWRSDIDDIEIGGRNYVLKSEIVTDRFADASWTDAYMYLSDGIRGLAGEFELGFDVMLDEGLVGTRNIDFTLQIKGGGLPTFTIFPYKVIALTPGVATHLSSKFTGDFTAFTSNGGRIAVKFGGAPDGLIHVKKLYIKKGNKVTDWTPAPEDTDAKFDHIETEWTQTFDGFKTTVQDTYATKTAVTQLADSVELKATKTDVTALTGRVSTAEGKITTQAGKIDLAATKTELTTAIDCIEIGGRNLLRNSNFSEGLNFWVEHGVSGSVSDNIYTVSLSGIGLNRFYYNTIDISEVGPTVTVSLDARASSSASIQIGQNDSIGTPFGVDTNWKRISRTFNPSDTTSLSIRLNTSEVDYQITNIKLEKGNKATDWTTAPEDVDSAISTVQSKLTVEAGKITTLTTKTDGHTTQIGQLQTSYNGLSSTVSALETGKVGTTAFSALEQNLNGFKTTVQNTYADKTTVTALATQWTQTTELANGHTSQINSLGTAVNLRATKTEVDDKILADKTIKDTRNDNQLPPWYYTNYPKQKVHEFKRCTIIGLPADAGTHATVVTAVPRDSELGGPVEQTATAEDGVYQRRGTATWSAWAKVADSSNIISQINISPETILIASKKIQIKGDTYIDNSVIKTAHIADLAVSGAKIADASITSAKIISLDASKITADTLSAITTNTGALNVSGWLTTTTENFGFRGTYDYGDNLSGAYNPRWFDGDYRLSHRYLTFQANAYNVTTSNTRGAFKYYTESFYGPDYLKLRHYPSSSNTTLGNRVDITADKFQITSDWSDASGIVLNADGTSVFGARGQFNAGLDIGSPNNVGLRVGRIDAPLNFQTLILNANRNLGALELGYDTSRYLRAKDVYDRTYSLASNMIVTEEGTLGRATSARKYKTNIVELKEIYSKAKDVLQIQPVTWLDKRALVETGTEQRGYGFIADEFHELGLTEVVQYGTDGQVEGLAYDRISMYHNVILQDHEKEISALKTTMNFDIWQLKNEIKELKNEINSLRQAVA